MGLHNWLDSISFPAYTVGNVHTIYGQTGTGYMFRRSHTTQCDINKMQYSIVLPTYNERQNLPILVYLLSEICQAQYVSINQFSESVTRHRRRQ